MNMEKQLFQEIINDLKNDDDAAIVATALVETYKDDFSVNHMIEVIMLVDNDKVDKINLLVDLIAHYQRLLKYIRLINEKAS